MVRQLLFAVCVPLVFATTVSATPPALTFSGQVRTRSEYDDRSFTSWAGSYFYTDMRTRFGIAADIDTSVHAFIQFQDSRRFGALANDRPATSTNTDNKNVDLHQAWLAVDNFPVRNLRFQAGRFELSFGNERVIGAGDWHNVSRAFEGLNLSFKESNTLTNLFALQLIEGTSGKLAEEYMLYGSNVSFQKLRLDFLLLYEYDSDCLSRDCERMRRLSLGGYFNRQLGNVDLVSNAVYQMGSLYQTPSTPKQDIAAYLLTAEAGMSTGPKKTRVALGVDWASGDDNASLGDMTAYDNLYYTGHKFRGFMDYYLTSSSTSNRGLLDLMLRFKHEPQKGWIVRWDLHRFATAKAYAVAGDPKKHGLGWEADLVATTTRVKGFKFEMGAATFLPDESYYGVAADPGFWTYLSAAVDF